MYVCMYVCKGIYEPSAIRAAATCSSRAFIIIRKVELILLYSVSHAFLGFFSLWAAFIDTLGVLATALRATLLAEISIEDCIISL